ncbi:uncharacterized protein AruCF_2487 [Achromobacter ruhlandii]|nr:uncharacterized protein AruCF_2487 [Achromobacter ruhlandii]
MPVGETAARNALVHQIAYDRFQSVMPLPAYRASARTRCNRSAVGSESSRACAGDTAPRFSNGSPANISAGDSSLRSSCWVTKKA